MYRGITDTRLKRRTSIISTESYDPVARMSVQPIGSNGAKELNINRYATKKTIAQGMLDIALLTANASQLRYILTLGKEHQFFEIMLGLIVTSIILQVLVGVLFLIIGAIDLNQPENHSSADILNNITVALVFIVSVINVVINGFGIEQSNRVPGGTVIQLKKQ